MLILDNFFLKHEGERGQIAPPPPVKNYPKKASLIRVKVIILRWEGASHKEGTSFYWGVDPTIHHERDSHYVILLF